MSQDSRSDVQVNAEPLIIEKALGRHLDPYSGDIEGPGGKVAVQLDGYDPNGPILCEVYAHIGSLRGSQPDKPLADAAKLLAVEAVLGRKCRKLLIFADERAANPFRSGWKHVFCTANDFEIKVAKLGDEERAEVEAAQRRQGDGWRKAGGQPAHAGAGRRSR